MANDNIGPMLDSMGWAELVKKIKVRKAEYEREALDKIKDPETHKLKLAELYGHIEELEWLIAAEF